MSLATNAAGVPDDFPPLPESSLWMTRESASRLRDGGNCKGAVPVHGKRSATAKLPLFTAEQMHAYRRAAYAQPAATPLSGWTSLTYTQWMSIVNHAVKLAEAKRKEPTCTTAAPVEQDAVREQLVKALRASRQFIVIANGSTAPMPREALRVIDAALIAAGEQA